jgi:hypothetical protein
MLRFGREKHRPASGAQQSDLDPAVIYGTKRGDKGGTKG